MYRVGSGSNLLKKGNLILILCISITKHALDCRPIDFVRRLQTCERRGVA